MKTRMLVGVSRLSSGGVRKVFACVVALAAIAVGGVAEVARAGQVPPDYGMTWCTVGDPGNRLPNAGETGSPLTVIPYGSVAREFRITRTEVTNAQYLGFVRAYLSVVGSASFDISGPGIVTEGGGSYVYPGGGEFPATMSWVYAARYCNWLHNAQAMTVGAFERGVYDTSTFYRDQNGVNQHQVDPAPGAKFWIPSFSEWVKAAFWDPRKPGSNGNTGGYWRFPNSTDTSLTSGLPSQPDAQTNAGTFQYLPVGSYPTQLSPWGLLDVSGSARELTGTLGGDPQRSILIQAGTSVREPAYLDRLAPGSSLLFSSLDAGLRLASIVPSPGLSSALLVCACSCAIKRRR